MRDALRLFKVQCFFWYINKNIKKEKALHGVQRLLRDFFERNVLVDLLKRKQRFSERCGESIAVSLRDQQA